MAGVLCDFYKPETKWCHAIYSHNHFSFFVAIKLSQICDYPHSLSTAIWKGNPTTEDNDNELNGRREGKGTI